MQWVKPDVKLQPNMLAVQAARNGAGMFQCEDTREFLHSNMKKYIAAYVIGNYGTALPVGLGTLGTDIGSFNLWMKRLFPTCRYERLRDTRFLANLENAPRCVVWIKNFAVYVEAGKYYSFRDLDDSRIFAIWWL